MTVKQNWQMKTSLLICHSDVMWHFLYRSILQSAYVCCDNVSALHVISQFGNRVVVLHQCAMC